MNILSVMCCIMQDNTKKSHHYQIHNETHNLRLKAYLIAMPLRDSGNMKNTRHIKDKLKGVSFSFFYNYFMFTGLDTCPRMKM